ncbi:MAG TPA: hypothetical protein VFN96_04380, partial [Gemmatimonadales bacterium]|nr:hypothetical protein [Gemmatimonadales bacterium]
ALDLGAERARFLRETAAGFTGLWEGAVPFLRRAGPAREPDSTALGTAIESVAPVRAFASALRLRGVRRAPDDSASAAELRERQRLGAWEAATGSGLPPAGWRDWTATTWSLFRALHGGDLPADTAFFRRAVEYAARARAPEPVHASIGLARALTGRDAAGGAAAARVLLAEARAGRDWIPVDDLLDGAVRSLAETGEAGAARRAFETLLPRSSRRSGDLRLLLLDAEIERARGDR